MVPESERPDADEASEILSACAALPLTERSAFLDTRCAGRPTLRSEVEELLSFLHDPEFEEGDERDDETARARRRVGSEIGGCRLVELLAMGGMGAVYRAEQESPRREVALKLLRPDGLGTDAWRRLKREALVLGRLDHPAIARVFTAGIHRDAHGATPYLIMELVEGGRPMSDWWRERDLPLARRIALFATVCEAIHHGHIKGVLHRDVKPGNLLVDREDRPKVIDFGIARMLEPGSDDENAPATEGRVIGTIAYMAPERLDGSQAIDVRSDVYGLGIVLYELLTGRLPFGRPNGSIAATATAIALGQVAPPSSVDRRCRGDLDAIVAKAMSADPADRYDSASALAADLRSHLENGPIQARGVGRVTRVRKFLVRNRIATTAMVAVFVALAIGLSLSLRATAAAERSLYLSLLAQGSLMASRNDMGSALRVLKSLGPDRQGEWPVRAIARFTNPTIDSARFEDWRLFRGRLSPNRDRLLAYGCGERPELIVMKSSPAGIQGRIPLPSPGMGADWGIRLPDGTETAIAGLADGRVIEVVATDGSIIREITRIHPSPSDGPTGPISDVALEPGGRRLAVAHSSDSIRLVDLQDGSAVDHHGFSDPASPDWIFVEWHPKGGTLAAAASGGTYVIGEPDGSVRRISSRPSRQSTFSPDGLRLATALTRGGSEIIEVSSGTSTMILPSAWPAWGVDWSPDGQFVSVVGDSHWMVVFDSAGRIRRWQRSNISDARTVRWISETEFIILPVGQVYSFTTPQGILPPTRLGHEHSDRVELRARFDDDGRYLICTGPEGQIDRVDPLLETRVELARMPVLAASTDVSPDGSMVAVVDGIRNGPLWLFDTRDGSTRRIDGDFRGPVMFSPDARRIVIMGRELEAIVIHLESGRIEHRHERTSAKTTVGLAWLDPESLILADSRHTTMLAMEGDKRWVSRPMPIESVRERWPIGSGHWYSGFGRDADSISGMSFLRASEFRETVLAMGIAQCMAPHPTRPLTAVGMTSGLVVIYDESLEAVVSSHEVMSRRVTSIAWTPDGEMVAAIDAGGGIRIIDSMPLVERWPEIDRTRRLISATAADPSPSAPPSGDAEPD